MKRLILCALALTNLTAFGAASESAYHAAPAEDPDKKPFNLYSLLKVTQGESKMPYQIAFLPIGKSKVLACLVADPKLSEYFPDDMAQKIVDVVGPSIAIAPPYSQELDSYYKKKISQISLSNIKAEGLRAKRERSRLTAIFIFERTFSFSRPIWGVYLNGMGSHIWSEVDLTIKVDDNGAAAIDWPQKDRPYMQELCRRKEWDSARDLWREQLATNGHDFSCVIDKPKVDEYFKQSYSQPEESGITNLFGLLR